MLRWLFHIFYANAQASCPLYFPPTQSFPYSDYIIIKAFVKAGGFFPAEILFFTGFLHRLKLFFVFKNSNRPLHRFFKRRLSFFREQKSSPAVVNCIRKPAGFSRDGNRAVSHRDHLPKSGGFKKRRHQEKIGIRVNPARQRFVKTDFYKNISRIFAGKFFEFFFKTRLALPQKIKLGAVFFYEIRHNRKQDGKAFLKSKPGHKSEARIRRSIAGAEARRPRFHRPKRIINAVQYPY